MMLLAFLLLVTALLTAGSPVAIVAALGSLAVAGIGNR